MDNFKRLSMQELYDVEGGIFGVDDAIFWTLVAAGFAGGIATGVSRKNRKKIERNNAMNKKLGFQWVLQ